MALMRFLSAPCSARPRGLGAVSLALIASAAVVAPVRAQVQEGPGYGRVISVSPIDENGSPAGYSVTYDYQGRQYTTRTATPPGPTIPVQTGAYGVTTYPVTPQPEWSAASGNAQPSSEPEYSSPGAPMVEPGVVVSADGVPYGAPPPAYPAPVYVAPSFGYGYPGPYAYPPLDLSFNLGYSRGWYRGWHGRRWR